MARMAAAVAHFFSVVGVVLSGSDKQLAIVFAG
jgi:hypothetical protein